MPKVMVFAFGDGDSVSAISAAAADGAKRVRFTEVDVRWGDAGTGRRAPIESPEEVAGYDGVLIASSSGALPDELAAMLDGLSRTGDSRNMVFGLAGGAQAFVDRVSRAGAIVVGQPAAGNDELTCARMLGERVANVAGWVRHGLGHAAEHAHGHGHEHEHGHSHDDHHHE